MKKLVILFAALGLLAAACGGGDDDDSSGGFSSGGGGTLSASEWCDFNEEVEDLALFGDSFDPSNMESALAGFAEIIDDVGDRAPDEIREDVQTMGEAMADLDDILSEVDYDFLALSEADLAGLDDPAITEASDNINAFAEANCGSGSSDSGDADTGDSDTGDTDTGDTDTGGTDSGDEEAPEPDDSGDSGEDVDTGDAPDPNDSFRQIMVDSFMQSGMTEEQATCVVDGIDLDTLTSGDFDPFEFLDLYESCGVDLAQLQ